MTVLSHIATLRAKHIQLESQIQDAYLHHTPDNEVSKLKKLKLKIKEQIAHCEKLYLASQGSNQNKSSSAEAA